MSETPETARFGDYFDPTMTKGTGSASSAGAEMILDEAAVRVHGLATSMSEAIEEAGELLLNVEAVDRAYVDAMHEREELVSTFMGHAVAVPHGTNQAKQSVHRTAMSVVTYRCPIQWDGHEVSTVVAIAGVGDEHLALLQHISTVIASDERREKLRMAHSARDVLSVFSHTGQ